MGCAYSIREDEVGFKEVWGKFDETQHAGCHCINPCSSKLSGVLSTRVMELHFPVETKTKDNVFVSTEVTIQYRILKERESDAFYTLSDPGAQMKSYVFNNVRAQIPKYSLDELFLAKNQIASTLKTDLEHEMNAFGYTIVQTLVTDIIPDNTVKRAMNEINAASRMRVAANDKAEADKIQTVKAAEADAESKRLSGVGLAEQRKAIVLGLHSSIKAFTNTGGVKQNEVMELLLLNQYFDTLKEMTLHSKSTTVFVPHTPDTVSDLGQQVRTAFQRLRK